ncbi:MAG: hypothetical protein IPH84_11490 [Bacteroidales bacterium]|nr:hypothetical protein [Bacteroidales bacterium]
MKKTFIIAQIFLLIVLMACKSGKNGDIPEGAKEGSTYGVKSGIIKYKPMNMMGMTLTQTVFFDDYGNRETREIITEGSMMGQTMKVHAFDIREGLTNIHYELENMQNGQNIAKKEAYKESLPKEFLAQQNLAELSDELKQKMSYKEDGTETIAGIKGTRYTMIPDSSNPSMIATGVHYKNVPLKFAFGTVEMIADKVEFDVTVPADKFKVPADFKVIEKQLPDELLNANPEDENK